jgi:hypothetical protein
VAGSFAATKEMAKLLGENEFSALYHQGERDNIQLSLVGDRTILTVIFDDTTTLGMVRLYVSETVKRLNLIFEETAARNAKNAKEGVSPDDALNAGYSDSAKDKLDNLFS